MEGRRGEEINAESVAKKKRKRRNLGASEMATDRGGRVKGLNLLIWKTEGKGEY